MARNAAGDYWSQLEKSALHRLRGAPNPNTRATATSALNKIKEFADGPARGRTLFIMPAFHGDLQTSSYNEWSLLTFAEWLTVVPSKKTGKSVEPSTIETYISLIKTELGINFGVAPVLEGGSRLRRVLKHIASESPAKDRKKRRGLRGRHLKRAYKIMKFDKATSRGAVNDWAAVTTAREALARGAELTASARSQATPTRSDLTFEDDKYGPTATLWLRPLKKRGKAAAAKVPIVFAAYDGKGSDTYAALARLEHFDPVPDSRRATTPLFRKSDGSPMTQDHFRKLIKDIALALEFDPDHFGGHSPRIGGATDIGDKNPLLLMAKGRWAGDIAKIYNRLTRRGLVRASHAMQGKGARDMEEIYYEFAQPA